MTDQGSWHRLHVRLDLERDVAREIAKSHQRGCDVLDPAGLREGKRGKASRRWRDTGIGIRLPSHLEGLRAGAAGYIMKQEPAERVLVAIRQILGGEISLSENMEKKMMKQLVGGRAARTGSPLEDLSDRELEVFRLIGKGYSTRQIAEELHLSIKTIESHRAHIKEKLNLKNAMELVQHAIQWQEA